MIRHLCTRALWKGTKCHPAGVLGIIALFTFVHVILVRIGQYRTTEKGDANETDGNNSKEMTLSILLNAFAETESVNSTPERNALSQTVPLESVMRDRQICVVPSVLPGILQERRDRAKAACERLRKELPLRWRQKDRGPSSGILAKLRWDTQHHLLYCHLPKVASTTWAWHLLRGVGMNNDEIAAHRNVHILLQERLPPPKPEDYDNGFLNDALSFLVSRHPFHRLVSAYKNKIVEAEKRRQHYVDLRKTILEKYSHSSNSPAGSLPTFRDFCKYVVDSVEDWLDDLSHTPPPDLHWMPMTYVCSPCNLRYDVFSKMETMEADTNFIASQCGLSDVIRPGTMLNPSNVQLEEEEEEEINNTEMSISSSLIHGKENRTLLEVSTLEKANMVEFKDNNDIQSSLEMTGNDGNEKKDSGSESYSNYYEEFSKEELQRLYEIYRFDFEIFGYTMDEFR